MDELTESQHRAAKALASGNTEVEAAALAGVSRATVQRWKRIMPVFVQAIEQYRLQSLQDLQEATATASKANANQFLEDLREYQAYQKQIHQLSVSFGLEVIQRMKRIFNEMPDDAFIASVRDLNTTIATGQNLMSNGSAEWASAIGVDEVVEKMQADASQESR